jgi:DNA-binding MltR family transcriptional regulator
VREQKLQRVSDFDQDLIDSLNAESNRGIALVAAAILDEALLALLFSTILSTLSDDKHRIKIRDLLFHEQGPLQTFSAKIDLAYVSGGIEEQERKALHIIRKIRNDFAHTVYLDFSDQSIQARIGNLRELLFPKTEPKIEGRLLNKLGVILHRIAEEQAAKGTRDLFDLCVSSLHSALVYRIEDCRFKLERSRPTVYERLRWND